MRIGYITVQSLPNEMKIETLKWSFDQAYLLKNADLTDDPFSSQRSLMTLMEGLKVTQLSVLGDWTYIETSSGDLARGFIKSNNLGHGQLFNLEDQSEGLVEGILNLTSDYQFNLDMTTITLENAPSYFILTSLDNKVLGKAMAVEPLHYELQGTLTKEVTCVRFVPVYNDGTYGDELFNIAW